MLQPLDPKELFSASELVGDLSDADAHRLMALSTIDRHRAGSVIFREGEPHAKVYWIHSGRVTLEMSLPARQPRSLLTAGRGDVLAWSAFFGQRPMTASGTASTDTILLAFDAAGLRSLCAENHEIGYRVLWCLADGLSRRLVATRLQLLDLFDSPSGLST